MLTLKRQGGRHGHAFERREPIGHRRSREVGKLLGVVHRRFVKGLHVTAAEMAVGADAVAHRPAPQPVTGHAVRFAGNIPQGNVDGGDGGRGNDVVAVPEMLSVHHLPKVLNAAGILTDQQLADILHRARDRACAPFERALAPAPKARVIGDHLDKEPVAHARIANVGFDGGDFHFNMDAMVSPVFSMTVSNPPAATIAMLS